MLLSTQTEVSATTHIEHCPCHFERKSLTEVSFTAVGVQGDSRVYGYICILRAVTSLDMMSAEPYEFPWALLKKMSRRIVNEVEGIARVVYDTTSKPPGKTGRPSPDPLMLRRGVLTSIR